MKELVYVILMVTAAFVFILLGAELERIEPAYIKEVNFNQPVCQIFRRQIEVFHGSAADWKIQEALGDDYYAAFLCNLLVIDEQIAGKLQPLMPNWSIGAYEALTNFLRDNLTPENFTAWEKLTALIENPCWDRPTSSTGKYHQREDGSIPTVAEHTLGMLNAGKKIIRFLGKDYENKGNQADAFYLAIAFHDAFKYGLDGASLHTITQRSTPGGHGRIAANFLKSHKDKISLPDWLFNELWIAALYHEGRWSENLPAIVFSHYGNIATIVHILDMLDTNGATKEIRI